MKTVIKICGGIWIVLGVYALAKGLDVTPFFAIAGGIFMVLNEIK